MSLGRTAMAGEPTRVELDFPRATVWQFGHIRIGTRGLEDIVTTAFPVGRIVTIHIVVESTNEMARACTFEKESGRVCGTLLDDFGVCVYQSDHDKETHQLELDKLETSSTYGR